jgi:hypothetical protein
VETLERIILKPVGEAHMAQNESDREDLMREAVSLIRRIECHSNLTTEPIVAGFNSLGWLFVYSGQDLMYRFDNQGRLRRAFVEGLLFRTHGSVLASLERVRPQTSDSNTKISETILVRRDLSFEEMVDFRRMMFEHLQIVHSAIKHCTVTRQHPVDVQGLAEEVLQGILRIVDAKEFLAPAIVRR